MNQRSRFLFLSLLFPLVLHTADNPAGGPKGYVLEMTKRAGKTIYDNVTKDVVTYARNRATSTPAPVTNNPGSSNGTGILGGLYNVAKFMFGPSAKEQAHDREVEAHEKELNASIRHSQLIEDSLPNGPREKYQSDLKKRLEKMPDMTDAQIAKRERQIESIKEAELYTPSGTTYEFLKALDAESKALGEEKLNRLKKEVLHTVSTGLVMNTQTAQTTTTVTEATQTVPTEMSRLEKSIAERAKTIDSIENGWAGWWTSMQTANEQRNEQAKEKQKLAALQSEDKKDNKDKEPEKKNTNAIAKDSSKNKTVEEYQKHEQQQYEKHTRDMHKTRQDGQQSKGRNKNYTPRTKKTPEKATKPPHESNVEVEFQQNAGQKGHNFRPKEGHFKEGTSEAQQSIKDAIRGDHYRGEDNYGNHHYDYVDKNGDQIWAEVRPDGKIKNCGVNETHWPLDSSGFLSKQSKDKLTSIVGGGLSAIMSSSDTEAAEIRARIQATSGIPILPDAPPISKEERYMRENDELRRAGLPTLPLPPIDQSNLCTHHQKQVEKSAKEHADPSHFSIISSKENDSQDIISFTKGKDYAITNPREFSKVAKEYTPKLKSSETTGWGDTTGWGGSSSWSSSKSGKSSKKSSESGSGSSKPLWTYTKVIGSKKD